MNPAIDDYIDHVARHLHLRGTARQQALGELRDLLAGSPDPASVTGNPQDYAASLDEQFGTDPASPKTILGIPNSFTRGFGRRLANTFDPADPRIMVPRVFGAGWTINMGAIAVKLGLLRPDDVDDEVFTEALDHLRATQLIAAAAVVASGVGALATWRNRHDITAAAGKSQAGNLAFLQLSPIFCKALLLASANPEIPANQRITLPSLAAALSLMSVGTSAQLLTRPKGGGLVLAGLAASLPAELLLSYLPVRAALHRGWDRAR